MEQYNHPAPCREDMRDIQRGKQFGVPLVLVLGFAPSKLNTSEPATLRLLARIGLKIPLLDLHPA
jgi:hypothetical protein